MVKPNKPTTGSTAHRQPMRKASTMRIQKMMSSSSSYMQQAAGQPPLLLLPVQLSRALVRTRSHLALDPALSFFKTLLILLPDGAACWDSLKGAN